MKWTKVSFCMFIAVAVMCLMAAGLILIVEHSQPTSKAVLAYGGDTVLVDTVNTFWYSKWTANECLHIGDYYHTTSLYLVSHDALATYEYDRTIKSRVFQQPLPSRRTGMINTNMYLLDGSSIDYDICVTSETTQEQEGELYVFDNLDNFNAYLDEVSSGTQLSVYHEQLRIGAENITLCTHLHFLVRRPSYYFVTANGPGNIMYAYNATIHTVSFNHSQYGEQCRILDTFHCDVDIPSKLFEANTYSLLGYVHPQMITDPPSTHICASTQRSSTVIFVISTLAALIGIAIVVLILVVVCSCICSQKGKRGYRKITPIEVHIQ